MYNFKKDFPIFQNHPSLVFLDSTSSSQKPAYVIDALTHYLQNGYSNIHRGLYDIAMQSEKMYFESKKMIAKHLWGVDFKEIIYTYNSNYALNIIAQTLKHNGVLQAWDRVLLSIVEHHSNIVPWLILKQEIGIEIEFVAVNTNFDIDFEDFEKKYTPNTKVISLTHISNVTGQIFDLEKVGKLKRPETLFVVDGSQSIPHMEIDVKKLQCDFFFFTGHKIFAEAGIWVFWWKKALLESFQPIFSWGWAINEVKENCFKSWALPFRFEPGTPNVNGALSLLKAFEYIENIWGFETLEKVEHELVEYTLEKFSKFPQIHLIWSRSSQKRIGVFSFYIDGIHALDIADTMAESNICIRAGQHCTEPFMDFLGIKSSARMSLYLYNTFADVDRFFEVLEENFL